MIGLKCVILQPARPKSAVDRLREAGWGGGGGCWSAPHFPTVLWSGLQTELPGSTPQASPATLAGTPREQS